jgi:hypothetical protein
LSNEIKTLGTLMQSKFSHWGAVARRQALITLAGTMPCQTWQSKQSEGSYDLSAGLY